MESAISHERQFLRTSAEQLKDYLLSKELFWNTGLGIADNGRAYPQLTLGNLLFSEKVVAAAGADPQLVGQVTDLKQEWKSAWQSRSEREFQSRLESWREYIVYLQQYDSADSRDFATEVRIRTLLELLKDEAPAIDSELLRLLDLTDQHLRSLWKSGDFIWDEAIAEAFPPARFWFLYGEPDPKNDN